MDKDVIKNILQRFLNQFSERIQRIYGANVKLTVYSVGYFQNLEGKQYLHVFIDTDPEEKSSHNKRYIKDEVKDFLEGVMSASKVIVFIDERPLYNLSEEKLPFKEKKGKKTRIREFSQDVNNDELKWHVDEEDRMVKSLHKTDWMVQIDNELPQKLTENKEIFIPKGVYHRVIKGSGNLKVKVRFL